MATAHYITINDTNVLPSQLSVDLLMGLHVGQGVTYHSNMLTGIHEV